MPKTWGSLDSSVVSIRRASHRSGPEGALGAHPCAKQINIFCFKRTLPLWSGVAGSF